MRVIGGYIRFLGIEREELKTFDNMLIIDVRTIGKRCIKIWISDIKGTVDIGSEVINSSLVGLIWRIVGG